MKSYLPCNCWALFTSALCTVVVLASVGCADGSRPTSTQITQDSPPNFIIVVIDMLRPDHLGLYGYPKATSPNLDAWAEDGIVFDNAYSGAPWTYPSTVSLLTGLYPVEHGADKREIRQDPFELRMSLMGDPKAWLPLQFSENGYKTVAFHSHRFLHHSVSNIHQAFDEFYYTPEGILGPRDLAHDPKPWNDAMFIDTLYGEFDGWLSRNAHTPFLAYLHVIDVHGPYKALHLLEEDRAEVEAGLRDGIFEFRKMPTVDMYEPGGFGPHKSYLYDGHMKVVDDYLGLLRDRLDELELADNTYVIVTSDHGEGFGEHANYWGHGKYVFESEIRVPLIFLSHQDLRKRAGRIDDLVTTVGLLPTLTAVAGLPADSRVTSRSFFHLLPVGDGATRKRRFIVSETTYDEERQAYMTDTRYKLIYEASDDTHRLYDLVLDPREQSPLDESDLNLEVRDRLRELMAIQAKHDAARPLAPTPARSVDDEDLEALRGLGYLQ